MESSPGIYGIWRLRIQNIDQRTITLDSKSCLVLKNTGTLKLSPATYYVDSVCSDLTIEPREYSTLYFVWKASDPVSRSQNDVEVIPNDNNAACISFLVLQGDIGDVPLGQTIPFEAVFISNN